MTKDQIKKEFLAAELDYIDAIEALQQHCGLDSKEAEAIVELWEEELP